MKHYAGIDGSLEYASAAQSQADLPGDEARSEALVRAAFRRRTTQKPPCT